MLRLLGILALGNMICGNRRRNGSFIGSLFLLPALMFGGWIAVISLAGVFALFGTMIGGVFGGLDALAEGAFSVSGLVPGIILGLLLYFWLKKRNAAQQADEE